MLKYGDKEYRNLQEQVLANMRNIEDIIKDKPMMVNNIILNDSTYTPSDGTITLPDLVTTGTEQTVSAKKNFTNDVSVNGNFNVNGKSVCRAIYVHRIAFTIGGTSRFYHRILSTKSEPYTSISAVFADKANNSIDNVIFVDFVPMGSMGLLKFSDAGVVVDAVGIVGGNPGAFDTIGKNSISFVSDEVVGRWNA